jgi:hypothetical protein
MQPRILQRGFDFYLSLIKQVFICRHLGVHVDYRCCIGRDLLCPAVERVHLYLGRRERWPKVCQVFRIFSRMVVVHGMDDLCCE